MEDNYNKRLINLDIARTFAIICVVLCHSIQCIYKFNMQTWNTISLSSKSFMIISFTIARIGVPIFLCLTGALTLRKNFEEPAEIKKFYKKNLIPMIIVTEVWIILYNLYFYIFNNSSGSQDIKLQLKELIKNIFFIKTVDLPNMWYMPMIIGMYIVVPYLGILVKKLNIKEIKVPLILSIVLFMIIPTFNIVLKIFNKEITTTIDGSFLGGIYGIYIILGFYIYKGKFKNIKITYVYISTLILIIATVIFQFWLFSKNYLYGLWYNNIFLAGASLCIFEFFCRLDIKNQKMKMFNFIERISKYSLGIFFVHIIIQNMLYKYITKIQLINPLKVMLIFLLEFSISFVIVYLGSKLKYTKKYLFLIK